jgi:hypothetical protein
MERTPKISANFKDGSIAYYFNNINCEIKQSPKLMELYQFSLKSVYIYLYELVTYPVREHSHFKVTAVRDVFRRLVIGPSTLDGRW